MKRLFAAAKPEPSRALVPVDNVRGPSLYRPAR